MKNYHNTTNLTDPELQRLKARALNQDYAVLDYFDLNPEDQKITPEKVLDYWSKILPKKYNCPTLIISIRRSFNTCMKMGFIEKSGILVQGNKGRKVNAWKSCKH